MEVGADNQRTFVLCNNSKARDEEGTGGRRYAFLLEPKEVHFEAEKNLDGGSNAHKQEELANLPKKLQYVDKLHFIVRCDSTVQKCGKLYQLNQLWFIICIKKCL